MSKEHKSIAAVMLKIIDKGIETIDPENREKQGMWDGHKIIQCDRYHPNGAWDSKYSPLLEKIRNQEPYEECDLWKKASRTNHIMSYEQYAERQEAYKTQESLIEKNTVILPCGKNLPGWYWEVSPHVPLWTKEFDVMLPEREETNAAWTESTWGWTELDWEWNARLYNQNDTTFCKIDFFHSELLTLDPAEDEINTRIHLNMRDGRKKEWNEGFVMPNRNLD